MLLKLNRQLPGCIWSLIAASLLSTSPLLNTTVSSGSSDQAMHLTAEPQSLSPSPLAPSICCLSNMVVPAVAAQMTAFGWHLT